MSLANVEQLLHDAQAAKRAVDVRAKVDQALDELGRVFKRTGEIYAEAVAAFGHDPMTEEAE